MIVILLLVIIAILLFGAGIVQKAFRELFIALGGLCILGPIGWGLYKLFDRDAVWVGLGLVAFFVLFGAWAGGHKRRVAAEQARRLRNLAAGRPAEGVPESDHSKAEFEKWRRAGIVPLEPKTTPPAKGRDQIA